MPISEYTNPVQNTLEQYVPLPLQQMYQAASSIQQRGDLAQTQNDQVQTGLSSMEALAPGHRDFVNKFANDFKAQQSALLDKYKGNTSDPQYEQESRRLNMQFAADPRLQTIKQTNELWKKKQNIKDELDAKGIKYLDSNPNFTGKDANDNLSSNVGQLSATNFDANINQAFKDKEGAIEQVGHSLTNRRNLAKVHSSYVNQDGTLNTDNQDIQQGLAYYKQQGLSDQAAASKVKNHVDAGLGYAHDLKDHFYEISPYQQAELDLEKEKLDKAKQQNLLIPPFQLMDNPKPLVSTGTNSQDNTQATPNSKVFSQLQNTLKGLDKEGNLNAGERRVEDTPENRTKFGKNGTPGADNVSDPYGGVQSFPFLSVKDKYDPDEVNLLNTARKVLGVTGGSAKDVLSKYSDLVKSYDTAGFKITSTDNAKLNTVMADVARRQIATGEVYKADKNGNLAKVTDEKELDALRSSSGTDEKNNEIKNMQIAGISPKTLNVPGGALNGFTQFSNKGTNYYTGIPDQMQQKFAGSKSVDDYIQDFNPKNIQEAKITVGGKDQKVLINPNQQPINYIYQGIQGRLLPFKQSSNGKLGGGGLFQFIDPKTGQVQVAPIPLSELEREEKTSLFTQVVNDNKIKGD